MLPAKSLALLLSRLLVLRLQRLENNLFSCFLRQRLKGEGKLSLVAVFAARQFRDVDGCDSSLDRAIAVPTRLDCSIVQQASCQ